MLKVSTVLLSQHLNKTGRPTLDFDNHKSEELWYLLQVHAQETTFGVKKFFYCRLKLMAQRHIEQKIKDSHVKEDSPATSAPSKGKAKGKGKEHAKSNSDRADCIRRIINKPMFVGRCMCFQAWSEQERQRERTTSFTFSDRFTTPKFEWWWKKVVMTESQ